MNTIIRYSCFLLAFFIICLEVHGEFLDRIIAYGDEEIVITMSDLLIAKIQNAGKGATNREIIETLVRKEVLVKYIKRTNIVKIRYDEVEDEYKRIAEDPEIREFMEKYGIDPLYFRMNIEKQLLIYKFIEHSYLSSTIVTRDEIEEYVSQHSEYRAREINEDLLKEIEAKIREKKIDEKIQGEIEHLMKNINFVIEPEDIDL